MNKKSGAYKYTPYKNLWCFSQRKLIISHYEVEDER